MAPKQIINKTAETVQGWVILFGVVSGVISWVKFSKDANEAGILFALAAIIIFYIASSIKTTYNHVGGVRTDSYFKYEGWSYGLGCISGLISWGAFRAGSNGAGFLFLIAAVALFWIPSLFKGSHTTHIYK